MVFVHTVLYSVEGRKSFPSYSGCGLMMVVVSPTLGSRPNPGLSFASARQPKLDAAEHCGLYPLV